MDDPDRRVLRAMRTAVHRLTGESAPDPQAALADLVVAAVETVGPAVGGSITSTADATVHSFATTGDGIDELDRLQSDLRQGPCVSAADSSGSGVVRARDLDGPDRDVWPAFAPRAAALGWRSILSVRLSGSPAHSSALNLYARDADVFDDAAVFTATVFSRQAATLLHGVEHAELHRALETRDLIGQATGILMERFNLAHDQSFRLLVAVSHEADTALADVARWLLGDANRSISQTALGPTVGQRVRRRT